MFSIANVTNKPILDINRTTNNITIETGSLLTLNGKNFTVNGVLANNGTLRLQGGETVILVNGNDVNSGTWEYLGDGLAGTFTIKNWATSPDPDYFNLIINDTHGKQHALSRRRPDQLDIAAAFTISGGTYDANGQATVITGL